MFTPRLRLALIGLAMVWGVVRLSSAPASPLGWVAVIAAALLTWGYFRVGSVWLALAAYRVGNVERMREYVHGVRWPRLLAVRNRAHYHWLKGVGLALEGDLKGARTQLLLARRGWLRNTTSRSIVECQLADVALRSGERAKAHGHLACARSYRHAATVDRLIELVAERLEA
jgi:hypothetical protein